jgi:hypothetical protein
MTFLSIDPSVNIDIFVCRANLPEVFCSFRTCPAMAYTVHAMISCLYIKLISN